jgi:hypothetical protein
VRGGEHRMPVLRHENQVGVQRKYAVPTWPNVPVLSYEPSILWGMQLRYNYLLEPILGQRQALARTFGCVRVVFNDGLRARETPTGPGCRTSRTASCRAGSPWQRAPLSGRGLARCPRSCSSSRWPTGTVPTPTTSWT